MRDLPIRKRIRLRDYDYSRTGYYFVTSCTKDRHEALGKIRVGATAPGRPFVELMQLGKCVDETIRLAGNEIVKIDKYITMPNHIHIIIVVSAGDRGRSPLQNIVRNIKSYVTKWAGFPVWQKSFHFHVGFDPFNINCKLQITKRKWKRAAALQ